jgi:hypothetical protein
MFLLFLNKTNLRFIKWEKEKSEKKNPQKFIQTLIAFFLILKKKMNCCRCRCEFSGKINSFFSSHLVEV